MSCCHFLLVVISLNVKFIFNGSFQKFYFRKNKKYLDKNHDMDRGIEKRSCKIRKKKVFNFERHFKLVNVKDD